MQQQLWQQLLLQIFLLLWQHWSPLLCKQWLEQVQCALPCSNYCRTVDVCELVPGFSRRTVDNISRWSVW